MTRFSGPPVIFTQTTIYPNGKTVTSTSSQATYWEFEKSKYVDKDPPFKANTFNIKSYEVSETLFKPGSTTLRMVPYMRYDGVQFLQTSEGPHAGVLRAVNAIDKSYVDLAALKRLAVQEAFGKLNGVEWDLGVDLAEIKETIGLLPSLLKKAAHGVEKSLEAQRRRDKIDKIKSLKRRKELQEKEATDTGKALETAGNETADMHLLIRYGVMPIILSISDALELLKKQLEKADCRIRTKRKRFGKVVNDTRTVLTSGLRTQVAYHHECRVEGIVYFKRTMDQSMQQALGLLPERIPSIAWELISRSFVWDWFFNVGSFLDALQPKFDVEVLGTSYSEKQTANHAVLTEFQNPDGTKKCCKDEVFYRQRFKRTVNPTDIGQLAFTGLDRMTFLRELDAAALAFKPLIKAAKALFRK